METPASLLAALVPTGTLRAAINLGNPILANADPQTGQPFGVPVDLARELASLPPSVRQRPANDGCAGACGPIEFPFLRDIIAAASVSSAVTRSDPVPSIRPRHAFMRKAA